MQARFSVIPPFRQILHPSVFPGDVFHPAVAHHLFCLLGTLFCLAYHQVIVFS